MSSETIMIHVRFAPNGGVTEISERPAAVSPQDWFNWLSKNAGDVYQSFAGGRGVFRIEREELKSLRSRVAESAAAI